MSLSKKVERLDLTTAIKRRSVEGGGLGVLVGYAAKFNEPYNPCYGWPELVEVLHPDCFNRTLKEMPDVRALYNHNTDAPLGRVSAGTLRLKVDATGLGFEDDIPDTSWGRDAAVSVDRRDITGCSFGFMVRKDEVVSDRDTGIITVTLLDVDLFEISPAVTFPANESTEVQIRSRISGRLSTRSTFFPRLALAKAKRERINL